MDPAKEIEYLKEQRDLMVDYLNLKIAVEDWHGVADAAMDLREIDAKLVVLKQVQGSKP